MRILVTGCGGFIGTVLSRYLIDRGFDVVCLDRLFFGVDPVRGLVSERRFTLVHGDVRWFDPAVLNGVDVVVDLAAIANDPAGELNPGWTMSINFEGRVRVAGLARKRGVGRYVLASSCSVYGFREGAVDEDSPPSPLTTYAKANLEAERGVLPLAGRGFTVTVLRLATVYGYSPRTRLDLVVNAMAYTAFSEGRIYVDGDGRQARPLIHVRDVARAVELAITAEGDAVNGRVFNVGSNEQNYRIGEVAEAVRRVVGDVEVVYRGSPDRRSYVVRFDRFRGLGFEARFTVVDGVREVVGALESGELRPCTRNWTVKAYRYLAERYPGILDVPMYVVPAYPDCGP